MISGVFDRLLEEIIFQRRYAIYIYQQSMPAFGVVGYKKLVVVAKSMESAKNIFDMCQKERPDLQFVIEEFIWEK